MLLPNPSIFRGGSLSFAVSFREGDQSSPPAFHSDELFSVQTPEKKIIGEAKSSSPNFRLITKKNY